MLAVAGAALAGRSVGDGKVVRTGSGQPATNFALPNLREGGEPVRLADYRGRPVVVNFWASWCVPCRREMPAFEVVAKRMRGKVAFIGVNHQDGRTGALALLDETGVTYPAGYDPEGTVAKAYGLIGMPSTIFVSANGEIVGRRTGGLTSAELERAIDDLLL